MTSQASLDAAGRMGSRAGEAFRDTGVPSRNPFDQGKLPDLATAWRDTYLTEARPAKK